MGEYHQKDEYMNTYTDMAMLQRVMRLEKQMLEMQKREAERRKSAKEYARGEFPQWVKLWAWRESGGYCMNPHCRSEFVLNVRSGNGASPRYDHIIPRSCGGLSTVTNIQLICNWCNIKKGGCQTGHNHQDYRPAAMILRAQEEAMRQTEQRDANSQQYQLSFFVS